MYEIKRRVAASQTAQDGRLSLMGIIDMMQDCSDFQIRSEVRLNEYFSEHNLGMYLAFRQTDIGYFPEYGEDLTIRTYVYAANNLYGYRNTVIYDRNEKPIILSHAMGIFVDLSKGKPRRMPDEIIKTIPLDAPYEMDKRERKIKLPDSTPERMEPVRIFDYHLDWNRHVNNSRYIAIAQEYIDFIPKRVHIEYKAPAKRADILIPLVYTADKNTTIVVLMLGDMQSAVAEFVREIP